MPYSLDLFFEAQFAPFKFRDLGCVACWMVHLFGDQLFEFTVPVGKRFEMLLDRHGPTPSM
jgi:hypothetical protein